MEEAYGRAGTKSPESVLGYVFQRLKAFGKEEFWAWTECLKEQKGRVDLTQAKKRLPWGGERTKAEIGERLLRAEVTYALLPVMLCLSTALSLADDKTQERSDGMARLSRLDHWHLCKVLQPPHISRSYRRGLPDQKDHAGRDSAILRVAFVEWQDLDSASEVEKV